MARQESDREDLMAQARALSPRGEFCIPNEPQSVIAGYRKDGALSIYFGADPCFHFDARLRLRRAFVDGDLYRTQGETLARLSRVRTAQEVQLQRHDLAPGPLSAFLDLVADRLAGLLESLRTDAQLLQVVPAGTDLRSQLIDSLQSMTTRSLQLAPAIRGKR